MLFSNLDPSFRRTLFCKMTNETTELSVTARLAQSVEHETLNLRVVGSSPTLGYHLFSAIFFFFLEKHLGFIIIAIRVRHEWKQ